MADGVGACARNATGCRLTRAWAHDVGRGVVTAAVLALGLPHTSIAAAFTVESGNANAGAARWFG